MFCARNLWLSRSFQGFFLTGPLEWIPTWTLVKGLWSACFPQHQTKPEVDGRGFRRIFHCGPSETLHWRKYWNTPQCNSSVRPLQENDSRTKQSGIHETRISCTSSYGDFNFNGGGGRLKRTPVRPSVLLWHIKVLQSRLYHSSERRRMGHCLHRPPNCCLCNTLKTRYGWTASLTFQLKCRSPDNYSILRVFTSQWVLHCMLKNIMTRGDCKLTKLWGWISGIFSSALSP